MKIKTQRIIEANKKKEREEYFYTLPNLIKYEQSIRITLLRLHYIELYFHAFSAVWTLYLKRVTKQVYYTYIKYFGYLFKPIEVKCITCELLIKTNRSNPERIS